MSHYNGHISCLTFFRRLEQYSTQQIAIDICNDHDNFFFPFTLHTPSLTQRRIVIELSQTAIQNAENKQFQFVIVKSENKKKMTKKTQNYEKQLDKKS